jgi:hypothetical protein
LSVYRTYADPLAAAAASVFWRLYEAFYQPSRVTYLKLPEPITEFQRYKKESSVYRFGALFGWIRALRRDLSFFTVDDKTRVHTVEEAITTFEEALVEGKFVEAQRAADLAKLWGIALPEDPDLSSEAAVKMEEAVKFRYHIDELWRVAEMKEEEKLGAQKPDASVLGLAFAEQAGEGKELEVALPVGVSFLMQPLGERVVEVGVDQTLQQVVVLNRES